MKTKVCNACGEPKPITEFALVDTNWRKRRSYCKPCGREKQRKSYAKNKKHYINAVSERRKRLHLKVLEEVNKLKNVPCADCSGSFPSVCMDFVHIKGEKDQNVSVLVAKRKSLKAILAEINKCEVVCANCHRIRTQKKGY